MALLFRCRGRDSLHRAPAREPNQNDFEKTAKEEAEVGCFREFWGFLRDNNKWSLPPILIVLVLFSVLITLSGTGLASFIYTLF